MKLDVMSLHPALVALRAPTIQGMLEVQAKLTAKQIADCLLEREEAFRKVGMNAGADAFRAFRNELLEASK